MPPKRFTLAVACLYTASAVTGLTLAYLSNGQPSNVANLAVGMLPLSPVHNLVHLLIGLAAFLACTSDTASTALARVLAVLLGSIAVIGLLPPGAASATTLGLISTDGIWPHAVTALLAAYVGFAPPTRPRKRISGTAVAA